jgi:hypothetical protein
MMATEEKEMWTISLIRAHLNRIDSKTIVSTRDFLCYGTRSTVDSALHRLVKMGMIIRLARGVFVKWSMKAARGDLPSALEVARAKARGFGKELFVHKKDAAAEFGLIENGNENPTFATFGRATSFQFRETRIHLVHVSPKDAKHRDSFVGLFIRALRQLGYNDNLETTVMKLTSHANRVEKNNLGLAAAMMPSWLSDLFCSEKTAISQIKNLPLLAPSRAS